MDPTCSTFGAFAVYFRAMALLQQGHQLFEANSNQRVEQNKRLHAEALNSLQSAISSADERIVSLTGINALLSPDPGTKLSEQYANLICLLNAFKFQCEKVIEKIEFCERNHPDWVVKLEQQMVALDIGYRQYKENERKKQEKGISK